MLMGVSADDEGKAGLSCKSRDPAEAAGFRTQRNLKPSILIKDAWSQADSLYVDSSKRLKLESLLCRLRPSLSKASCWFVG